MQYKKEFTLSVSFFLLALLCSMIWLNGRKENLAQRIAPHILRFHVVAHSNSRKDQQIKLQIRDLLLEELSQAPEEGIFSSKASLCQYLLDNQNRLEESMDAWLASMDAPYKSHLEIASVSFPAKCYGDLCLPGGTYDALRVTLGDARGRNWWCVVYPRLCFTDTIHAVVPDTSKEQLTALLGESDYTLLLDDDPARFQIRFRLLDTLKNAFFDK